MDSDFRETKIDKALKMLQNCWRQATTTRLWGHSAASDGVRRPRRGSTVDHARGVGRGLVPGANRVCDIDAVTRCKVAGAVVAENSAGRRDDIRRDWRGHPHPRSLVI